MYMPKSETKKNVDIRLTIEYAEISNKCIEKT